MINLKFLNTLTKNVYLWKIRPHFDFIFIDWKNIICTEAIKLVVVKLKEIKENLKISIHKDDIKELKNDFEFYNWWEEKVLLKNEISEIKLNCWDLRNLPNYQGFIKNDNLAFTKLSIKELQKILKIYEEAWFDNIKLTIWTEIQPAIFNTYSIYSNTKSPNIEDIEAILMPVR